MDIDCNQQWIFKCPNLVQTKSDKFIYANKKVKSRYLNAQIQLGLRGVTNLYMKIKKYTSDKFIYAS